MELWPLPCLNRFRPTASAVEAWEAARDASLSIEHLGVVRRLGPAGDRDAVRQLMDTDAARHAAVRLFTDEERWCTGSRPGILAGVSSAQQLAPDERTRRGPRRRAQRRVEAWRPR